MAFKVLSEEQREIRRDIKLAKLDLEYHKAEVKKQEESIKILEEYFEEIDK